MRSATVFFGHLPLAFRLALREMRGGLRGFYIFMLCILLGTAAIAGVNSVARSMTSAIDAQGREIATELVSHWVALFPRAFRRRPLARRASGVV